MDYELSLVDALTTISPITDVITMSSGEHEGADLVCLSGY